MLLNLQKFYCLMSRNLKVKYPLRFKCFKWATTYFCQHFHQFLSFHFHLYLQSFIFMKIFYIFISKNHEVFKNLRLNFYFNFANLILPKVHRTVCFHLLKFYQILQISYSHLKPMFINFSPFLLKIHLLPFIIINFSYYQNLFYSSLSCQLIFVDFLQFLLQTNQFLCQYYLATKILIVFFFFDSPCQLIILNFKQFLLQIVNLDLNLTYYLFVVIFYYFNQQNLLIFTNFKEFLLQINFNLVHQLYFNFYFFQSYLQNVVNF